jgi:hypothetical protein
MGVAYTVIHTFKQNLVGGAFEALTAGTGDSLVVQDATQSSNVWLEEILASNSVHVADFDVRSPRLHDNVRGVRSSTAFVPTLAGTSKNIQRVFPGYARQKLYPVDTLISEVNGTAVDNVQQDFYIYYEDLPGADQTLYTWAQISQVIVNVVGIKVAVVAGAAGDYGATRALNADDDRLIGNTNYAVLGAVSQQACTLLTMKGPDTSNFRIPLPLHWEQELSASWFIDRSNEYQVAHIPVINSNNKGATLLEAADPAGAVATQATVWLAELSI